MGATYKVQAGAFRSSPVVPTALPIHRRAIPHADTHDLRGAMGMKAIRKKAEELLGYGLPKQQAYDLLMTEFPEAKPKKVAELLRFMPSQQARERFGNVHRALLLTIALHAVLRIIHPLLDADYDWASGFKYVSLVPIATVLVGWSIYRWQGQVLMWIGWANLASIGTFVRHSAKFASGNADPWFVAFAALPVLIGVLSLVLVYFALPGYKLEKDPLGGPDMVVFK